jgi:hypothetical protein
MRPRRCLHTFIHTGINLLYSYACIHTSLRTLLMYISAFFLNSPNNMEMERGMMPPVRVKVFPDPVDMDMDVDEHRKCMYVCMHLYVYVCVRTCLSICKFGWAVTIDSNLNGHRANFLEHVILRSLFASYTPWNLYVYIRTYTQTNINLHNTYIHTYIYKYMLYIHSCNEFMVYKVRVSFQINILFNS